MRGRGAGCFRAAVAIEPGGEGRMGKREGGASDERRFGAEA